MIVETSASGLSAVGYVSALISNLGFVSLPILLMPLIGKFEECMPSCESLTQEYFDQWKREIHGSIRANSSRAGINVTGPVVGGIVGAVVGMPFLGVVAGAVLGPPLLYKSEGP